MPFARAKWVWVVFFPLSCFWALLTLVRRRASVRFKRYKSSLKVICIGNIHSGGSGKTSVVKTIADHFRGKNTAVLARGYRGELSNKGARVNLHIESGANIFGDEPWMLASLLNVPVFIDKKRVRGIKRIEKIFSSGIVILDDGFQHFSLDRDLNLVCINADRKPVDSFCLPLGDLREPISAISSSDAVILTPGFEISGIGVWREWIRKNFPVTPVFVAQQEVEGLFCGNKPFEPSPLATMFSFCGIASPDRFVSTVQYNYPNSRHLRSFADHHRYTEKDIETLLALTGTESPQFFVTTDKDWAKAFPLFERRYKTLVSLRIGYKMADEFWVWLEKELG